MCTFIHDRQCKVNAVIIIFTEDIVKIIGSSGQLVVATGINLDNIKKNLEEYIKIYSNHAYQGNQLSIIIREIHKLTDKKNLADMTNIDFISE